ncbi:hypothetical protein [Natrarchaeobius oligotrophus]|uniref:hypothetical protein n=1 Tax=Natrarchaeobius oligotrophus TaxID=3455743 RepID=UPI000F522690|nr:hypothetical protein [Natrarchaeobius chitinivorans]
MQLDDPEEPGDHIDAATMNLEEVSGVSYRYALDNGTTTSSVQGSLSWTAIKDAEDSNDEVVKQGAATGRDTCEITAVGSAGFVVDLQAGSTVNYGDSGGPVSLKQYDIGGSSYGLVGGIVSGDDSNGNTWICAMPAIEDEFDVVV